MKGILLILLAAVFFVSCNKEIPHDTNSLSTPQINEKKVMTTALESNIPNDPEKIKTYERTIVTPVLETKILQDKNVIYSCTFQLVWNEFSKGDSLNSESELVKLLNKKMVTKAILSEKDYLTAIVNNANELKLLNESLKTKFGDNAPDEVIENTADGILFYSYMSKFLKFQKEFNEIIGGIYFGKNKVKTFGLQGYSVEKHAGLEKQVKIYDFKGYGDFIIELISKSAKDEIILANMVPKETLLDTIKAAEERRNNSKPESLKHADNLHIPDINMDLKHNYTELEVGGISKAYQWTKFALNKSGAEAKSEARIVYKDGGHERAFVFNKPFLIYLKEKGQEYPYLAIWVNNTEIMTPITNISK